MTLNLETLPQRLRDVRAASILLRTVSAEAKNRCLRALASSLLANETEILQANESDVARAVQRGSASAFLDRLKLSSTRLRAMRESLENVAVLADPSGEIIDRRVLASGVRLERVRAPLGVIFMIFEARPNVAIEAFSLALKSGNAIVLRGGSDARETTEIFYRLIQQALVSAGLPASTIWGLQDPDRTWAARLLREKNWIDVVVPRGGDKLIQYVVENSLIPIIKNDRGLCHLFVHEAADLNMATAIALNGKTQRPGVCNALETLLVDATIAEKAFKSIGAAMAAADVQLLCDQRAFEIMREVPGASAAPEGSFDTEHLELILNCAVVDGLEGALAHIAKHGSRHSEAIVTSDSLVAEEFLARVDSAAAYWNASTRFTDGFEFGLGGELGISTQKLHARGPIGLRELTCVRWIGRGHGQIRS